MLTLPIDAPRDALNELAEELRDDSIAILPAGRLEPALRRLHVLQSALDGRCRIACCQTDLSPLAASALVRLAASVARTTPSAALLADTLPALEQELLVAAVLPSVLRLRSPRPPFGARLRSLLPGGRFLVSRDPDPMVVALRRHGGVPTLLDDAGDEVAVVAAGRVRGIAAPATLLARGLRRGADRRGRGAARAGRALARDPGDRGGRVSDRCRRDDPPGPRASGGTVPVVRRAARGAPVRPLWT